MAGRLAIEMTQTPSYMKIAKPFQNFMLIDPVIRLVSITTLTDEIGTCALSVGMRWKRLALNL